MAPWATLSTPMIPNSENLLNFIRKMKYLTDQFQLCFYFCISNTKQRCDLVETSLKLRDRGLKFETKTRGFKFVDFDKIFQKNVVYHFPS